VESRSVPVTLDWLGVERDLDAELFSDTVEKESRHPELITHLNTLAWANLVLPLGWENLSVDTRDLDTGVQASTVVSLNDISAVDLSGTDTTVVWTLWTWETTSWPSKWLIEIIKESILLLETEPWDLVLVSLHQFGAVVAVVELVWDTVGVPALAKDEDVVAASEWIWVYGDWAKVDVGVFAWSLSGGGTIKVPFWKVLYVLWLLGEGSGLAANTVVAIDPDVLSLDLTVLWEIQVFPEVLSIGDSC